MKQKPTKQEIAQLERELCEQSHRIVFGVRMAVNPKRHYDR